MDERFTATVELPNGRAIRESGYVLAGFGIHRDSDPLAESNYGVAMRRLLETVGMDWRDVSDLGMPDSTRERERDRDPVAVGHFRHWAVGWVDELLIRDDVPALIVAADEMLAQLDDYPVLDEMDWSEREWESDHPGETGCYSDDPDCGCGRERA